MRKNPVVFLEHIEEAIQNIHGFVGEMGKKDFLKDKKTQSAVIRCLEIVGEAIRNLPEEFMRDWPQVPWRKIIGFRNILAHDYFDVDLEYVWRVIQSQLGKLEDQIKNILQQLKDAGES